MTAKKPEKKLIAKKYLTDSEVQQVLYNFISDCDVDVLCFIFQATFPETEIYEVPLVINKPDYIVEVGEDANLDALGRIFKNAPDVK